MPCVSNRRPGKKHTGRVNASAPFNCNCREMPHGLTSSFSAWTAVETFFVYHSMQHRSCYICGKASGGKHCPTCGRFYCGERCRDVDWRELHHGRRCGKQALTDQVLTQWWHPTEGPRLRLHLWKTVEDVLPRVLEEWPSPHAERVHAMGAAVRAGAAQIDALDQAVAAVPAITRQEEVMLLGLQRSLFEDMALGCERALGTQSVDYLTYTDARTHAVLQAEPSEDVRTFVLRLLRRAHHQFAILDVVAAGAAMDKNESPIPEEDEEGGGGGGGGGPTVVEIETPFLLGGEREDMEWVFSTVDQGDRYHPPRSTITGFGEPRWLETFCNLVFVDLWDGNGGPVQQFARASRLIVAYLADGTQEVLHHAYRIYYTNLIRQQLLAVLTGETPRDAETIKGYEREITTFMRLYRATRRGFSAEQRRVRREAAMKCFARLMALDPALFRNLGNEGMEFFFMGMSILRGMSLAGLFGTDWAQIVDRANRPVGAALEMASPAERWVKNVPSEWYASLSPAVKKIFPPEVQKFFVNMYAAFPRHVPAGEVVVKITDEVPTTYYFPGFPKDARIPPKLAIFHGEQNVTTIDLPYILQGTTFSRDYRQDANFTKTVDAFEGLFRTVVPHATEIIGEGHFQTTEEFIKAVRYLAEWQTNHLGSLFVVPILRRGFLGMWQTLLDSQVLFVGSLAGSLAFMDVHRLPLGEDYVTQGEVVAAMLQTHRVVLIQEFLMRNILGGMMGWELLEYEGLEGALRRPPGVSEWDFAGSKAPGTKQEFIRDVIRRGLRRIDALGFDLPWLYPTASLGLSIVSTVVSPVPFDAWLAIDAKGQVDASRRLSIRLDALTAHSANPRAYGYYKKQMWLHGIGILVYETGAMGMMWTLFEKAPVEIPVAEEESWLLYGQYNPLRWIYYSEPAANLGRTVQATGQNAANILAITANLAEASAGVTSFFRSIPWAPIAVLGTVTISVAVAARVESFVTGEKPKNTAVVAAVGEEIRAVSRGWRDYLPTAESMVTTSIFVMVVGETVNFLLNNSFSLFGQQPSVLLLQSTKKEEEDIVDAD